MKILNVAFGRTTSWRLNLLRFTGYISALIFIPSARAATASLEGPASGVPESIPRALICGVILLGLIGYRDRFRRPRH